MREHVCPWWGGYFIDNRLRRLLHQPEKILAGYLQPGLTVMDFGCGMGFFSIPMAKMIGMNGSVIAVDLQPQMLRTLRKRAERAGVAGRLRTHACGRDAIGVDDPIDFVLAFWSAHRGSRHRQASERDSCRPGKWWKADDRRTTWPCFGRAISTPDLHCPAGGPAAYRPSSNPTEPGGRICQGVAWRIVRQVKKKRSGQSAIGATTPSWSTTSMKKPRPNYGEESNRTLPSTRLSRA